jgi:hypothetical protein
MDKLAPFEQAGASVQQRRLAGIALRAAIHAKGGLFRGGRMLELLLQFNTGHGNTDSETIVD